MKPPHRRSHRMLLALSAVMLVLLGPARARGQAFVDLRDAGFREIVGVGTSRGQAVIVAQPLHSSPQLGPVLRWTAATGTVGIGPPGNHPYFKAEDISADASTLVGRALGRIENPNRESAYVWEVGKSITEIAWEIREAEFAAPSHLSADGKVAAGRGAGAAYRWSRAEGLSDIGGRFDEVPDKPLLWVEDLSHDGAVIVGTTVPVFYDFGVAARWTAATGMTTLGVLPDTDHDRSWASSVSADGSIVVGNSYRWSTEYQEIANQEAFRWTEESGMVGLGWLEGGDQSYASFIAGDGSFILGASNSLLDWRKHELFYWTLESGMQRLVEVLGEQYGLGDQLAGWELLTIEALSADSRFIVGSGVGPDGRSGHWLIDLRMAPVPEPASYALVSAAGLIGLAILRERRRRTARA